MKKAEKDKIKEALSLYSKVVFSTKYKNQFKVLKGYFYKPQTYKAMPDHIINSLKGVGIEVKLLDSGDHYHDFVGGSEVGSKTSSFLWWEFTLVRKDT